MGGEGEVQGNELEKIIKNVRLFRDEVIVSEMENYLDLARYYVKKWNEDKMVKKIPYNLERHVSNYSISEVIQMMPIEYQL